MIDCMIIGDSIAVGVANERPECVAYVKGGLNSYQWNNKYLYKELVAGTMIISLGTNDHEYLHTFKELLALRQTVTAQRVFWVLPQIKPSVQENIRIIAKNFGDTIITTQRVQKDKIHPSWAGYKELANQTK